MMGFGRWISPFKYGVIFFVYLFKFQEGYVSLLWCWATSTTWKHHLFNNVPTRATKLLLLLNEQLFALIEGMVMDDSRLVIICFRENNHKISKEALIKDLEADYLLLTLGLREKIDVNITTHLCFTLMWPKPSRRSALKDFKQDGVYKKHTKSF